MRVLGYLWASPVTAIGLALALLTALTGCSVQPVCRRHRSHRRPGRLAVGNRLWRGGAAMTLGHFILARDAQCLEQSRPHEERHVRRMWCRGHDAYLDYPLEPPPG